MAQSPPQPKAHAQSPPQPMAQSPPQPKPQQPQLKLLSQPHVLPQSLSDSPELRIKPQALAQAPPQAYTEAYAKAQALARNGFEEAKHCLQEHILEAINVFKDKCISTEQASVKEETLRTLDPELLEEFLRAAEGMEAFCTPFQLRDMEFFTQSVRTQWEACFSAEGSLAQAGQHLEALKELCDTLSPEDAHRLAQAQLRECEKRLAAIQRQFSGDQEAPPPVSGIPTDLSQDQTPQKEPMKAADKPQVSTEVSQVTVKTSTVERREVEKQTSIEEDLTRKDTSERYDNCKRTLQSRLAKNEQSIQDVPSDSVSLKGLHTRLQEIQFLRQETESLWSDYVNQCSQATGSTGLEQERVELQEQWRGQQVNLQRRGSSLGAALRQIDSTENHMVDFTDRLDRYLRQPKDITAFTLANTNMLTDIKELEDNIQSELDQLSRLDSESSDLDRRDRSPLSREVETHRTSLDQLRQQVRKSEAAARALDRFLMSLRTVDQDVSGVQGAPCSDGAVLQDCRSKLALIRQSIDSLRDKAPQLDLLLQGARLTVTRDGAPASCLDMVAALGRRVEEADGGLASQQQSVQRETEGKSLGLRKRTLLGELRKLQEAAERQGLKEPTMPAVQQRLRALADLEAQLQARRSELHSLRELQGRQGGENLLQELDTQWEETQGAVADRQEQCSVLMELLKKFQSCRSHLSNTMQRAEQTISEQASYMGKDNLQRLIAKVHDIKEDLSGLGERMEEIRGVCRQLQSHLKKIPDCSEAPFEAEADALVDSWLDVTEKTDAHMDNLQVGLELWEKQLMLGGEVDGWAGAKLALFAESHPFHSEQQVLAMRDEIHDYEENIERFHKKSIEIQEMLQSQEAPLELQVMETQLRKRMEQVKELFTDSTDVFEELIAVKKHLAEKMEDCRSAIENIQSSLSKVTASDPQANAQIQDLCEELEAQEEQAEAVLKEVGLVSSVANPQVLEALSADCGRLKEAVSHTKDMIHLKRQEREKGLVSVIQGESQLFEQWFQDLQLSVNECFENPESRTDVETSLQRLAGFLASKDGERRLDQLRDQLERGREQVPAQQLAQLADWLKEQQEEVATFRTHCLNRQKQMESVLSTLNSLQEQHDGFREWLQTKEKQSMESDRVKHLLKDLQDESGRAEGLSELLALVRRQGVRADSLLKDGDNLLQRYRNLEARLQQQAEAQSAAEGELDGFNAQAESTRAWIRDLLQPLTSHSGETQAEERKHTAQAILSSKPEGDSKVNNLRRQGQSLCDNEDLKESRRREVQQTVRDTEEQWRTVLQAAEEALNKAETQAVLGKDFDAFKTQNEGVQSWIRDQKQKLQSVGHMQFEERLRIAQAVLNSKAEGDSKLQELKGRCQSLCEHEDLKESRRREVQQTVRDTEEQWGTVLEAAEEALNKAETQAVLERDCDAFKTQNEGVQSWIRDQNQSLQSLGGHMQFEERAQTAQAVLGSRPEGDSKINDLRRQGQSLYDNEDLNESRRREVQQTVRDTEEQWGTVLQAAEEALNKAERQAVLERDFDTFKTQNEGVQSWIRDQKQKLLSLGSHMSFEERLQIAQAVMNSKPEAESKVNDLKRRGDGLCEHEDLEESRRQEVQLAVRDTEQQWRTVLQAAGEAEVRSLSDDFDTQRKDAQSWIRDRQQRLQSVSGHTPAEERCRTAQTVLSSKPEGDCKVNNLRRRGQSLCDREDLEESRRREAQQTVRDTEEQWRTVLQAAKQTVDDAEAQIALETEMRVWELREFDTHKQDTGSWVRDLQQRLNSLSSQTKAEDRRHAAQAVLSSKPEGDAKLQELRRRSQRLCEHQDLEESKKLEVQQTVRDSEEQWRTVLRDGKQALDQAERQCALEGQLRDYEAQRENTRSWVGDKQQGLLSLDSRTDPEKTTNAAQTILSSKPEGDSKVAELRRQSQSLCENEDLEESRRREVQQTVKDTEEQWRTVLQAAEEALNKAEVHYSLSRELEAFRTQAESTRAWVEELQRQADSMGSGTQGSQAQIQDRLNTAQAILSSKSKGEAQVMELKRRARSLCEYEDLEESRRQEVQQTVKDTEEQRGKVLQAAEEVQRQLKGVVERLVSCQHQRGQAQDRLAELQGQTAALPRLFPWPGLGDRRQAMEQTRTLLDRTRALGPVLSSLRTQGAELFQITQDPGWSDPSWAAKEESIPTLLKELTEAGADLELGILTERQCTQLVEQHGAAQDWLREQVKGLGAPPADRQGLHSAVNTLKALLQTVDREEREMKELDSVRDKLLSLCTPGGRDALTLEVSQLHQLCASSEQEVRQRLASCEARLQELDGQLTRRADGLKERAAALQWELRSLDQALSYSEPQNNIVQLQQHWQSLKNCEKSLEGLGAKTHDLYQEVKSAAVADELPADVITMVESLNQKHDRLSERQGSCSMNTARCLTDCLHALQQWNHRKPSESISSVQVALEEGEKMRLSLREALSHQQFLLDSLKPELLERLEKESSETLKEADTQTASLSQSLKEKVQGSIY
ncbi:nesprin-2-like [Centroberyx affinis]|uniref:nesprin-2-like n=1 Tax=Centroberyx affinis TaxID=166261 RepID=UPI003A5BE229